MNEGQSDESVLHAEKERVWAIYLTTGLCLECSSSLPADPQLFGFYFFFPLGMVSCFPTYPAPESSSLPEASPPPLPAKVGPR